MGAPTDEGGTKHKGMQSEARSTKRRTAAGSQERSQHTVSTQSNNTIVRHKVNTTSREAQGQHQMQ